jgi:FdhD protein
VLCALPDKLRNSQKMFESTGAIHACALFDTNGNLIMLMEDVGRHNALDKLVGASLMAGMLPANEHILLLSGRASFELIQKAAMAGIKIVAAVGAPSSLAVQMAEEWGMTLVGFLRGTRFNIYAGGHRIGYTYPSGTKAGNE